MDGRSQPLTIENIDKFLAYTYFLDIFRHFHYHFLVLG